jgi:hypothetical protein
VRELTEERERHAELLSECRVVSLVSKLAPRIAMLF